MGAREHYGDTAQWGRGRARRYVPHGLTDSVYLSDLRLMS